MRGYCVKWWYLVAVFCMLVLVTTAELCCAMLVFWLRVLYVEIQRFLNI